MIKSFWKKMWDIYYGDRLLRWMEIAVIVGFAIVAITFVFTGGWE